MLEQRERSCRDGLGVHLWPPNTGGTDINGIVKLLEGAIRVPCLSEQQQTTQQGSAEADMVPPPLCVG